MNEERQKIKQKLKIKTKGFTDYYNRKLGVKLERFRFLFGTSWVKSKYLHIHECFPPCVEITINGTKYILKDSEEFPFLREKITYEGKNIKYISYQWYRPPYAEVEKIIEEEIDKIIKKQK